MATNVLVPKEATQKPNWEEKLQKSFPNANSILISRIRLYNCTGKNETFSGVEFEAEDPNHSNPCTESIENFKLHHPGATVWNNDEKAEA